MPKPSPEEHSPLEECFIQSFDAGDTDFPIVARKMDPRDPGYAVPPDLTLCADPRYPLHKFTGVTPIADDRRVLWIYRILPGPATTGQHFDNRLGIVVPFTAQDVEADTADGTPQMEIAPDGVTVDKTVTTPVPSAALDAFCASFPDYANIPLPAVLTALAVYWSNAFGDGASGESGTGTSIGTSVNLSLSMQGSGQCSASVVAEIIPTYEPQRGEHAPVMDYYFYMAQPFTHAGVLAKVNSSRYPATAVTGIAAGVVAAAGHTFALDSPFRFMFPLTSATGANLSINTTYYARDIVAGVSFGYALTPGGAAITTGNALGGIVDHIIQAWPNFRPREDTLVLQGQKASLSLKVSAKCAVSISGSDVSVVTGRGAGYDKDISPSIRAVVLKEAIHDVITPSGLLSDYATGSVTAAADTGGDGNGTGGSVNGETGGTNFPGAGLTRSLTMSAYGSVHPTSLAATPVTSIPTFGKYLLSMPSDLSEYTGYSIVRARIVDFANV